MDCRYIGYGPCEIGLSEYGVVGEARSFSEKEYRELVLAEHGADFLLKEEFDRIGFTREELKKHGSSGTRIDSKASSFLQKLWLAQSRLRQLRSEEKARQLAE